MVSQRRTSSPQSKSRRQKRLGSIWDTPHMKQILSEPVGTPMKLTPEEARAIIDEHFANALPPDPVELARRHRELRRIRRESGAILVGRTLDVNG